MTDTPPVTSAADPQPGGFWRGVFHGLREIVIIVVMAMVLSLVVKTWIAQAFFIPSGSMEPTLQRGDRVMVSKIHRAFSDIHRGDIVVFRDPAGWLPPSAQPEASNSIRGAIRQGLTFIGLMPDPGDEHLIKRVVGVGGDHVVCCDDANRLVVNGAPIEEPYVYPGDEASSIHFDIRVPEDSVWVMGDHRSDSQDSRFHPLEGDGTEGSIPLDHVVGRAVVTVWPFTRLGTLDNHPEVFSGVPAP